MAITKQEFVGLTAGDKLIDSSGMYWEIMNRLGFYKDRVGYAVSNPYNQEMLGVEELWWDDNLGIVDEDNIAVESLNSSQAKVVSTT